MDEQLKVEIYNLWHISRCALGGFGSRHERMIYIKKQLLKDHFELVLDLSHKKIWLFIEDCLD